MRISFSSNELFDQYLIRHINLRLDLNHLDYGLLESQRFRTIFTFTTNDLELLRTTK